MITQRITYQRFTRTFTKSVPCTVCGKKVRRQRTIGQTQSPFNLTDGRPSTVPEIYAKLAVEGEEWIARPETHPACAEAGAGS